MRRPFIILLIFLAALPIAEGQRLKVETVFDETGDFALYKSYEFLPGRVLRTNELLQNESLARQIEAAILDKIKTRGGREDVTKPDLRVTYFFGIENRSWANRFDEFKPYGSGGARNNPDLGEVFLARPQVTPRYKGVLVIDLVDAKANKLVWRAYCSAKLGGEPLEPEKRMNLVRKAVDKAFAKYPPKIKR